MIERRAFQIVSETKCPAGLQYHWRAEASVGEAKRTRRMQTRYRIDVRGCSIQVGGKAEAEARLDYMIE